MFSRAWARAPRWAKPIGGSRSDGQPLLHVGSHGHEAGRAGPIAAGPRGAGHAGSCTTAERASVDSALCSTSAGGELVVILLVALIVLGPDKLPDAIRKVGRVYGELRRMSSGFQAELRDALDEPMREVRRPP